MRMSEKDPELEYSSLGQRIESRDKCVHVFIYRCDGSKWVLEVEDEQGNSTVWTDEFNTDVEALAEVKRQLKHEGIGSLIGEPG